MISKLSISLVIFVCLVIQLVLRSDAHAVTLLAQRIQHPKPVIQTPKVTSDLNHEAGTVLVKFKTPIQAAPTSSSVRSAFVISGIDQSALPASIQHANKLYGLTTMNKVVSKSKNKEFDRWYVLRFRNQDARAIATTLRKQPDIQYVNLNYKIEFFADDPMFSQQWHLHSPTSDIDIDALEAFDLKAYGVTPKNTNTIVSVIDHPLYVDHSDLKDSIWVNAKEIPNDGIDNDNNGYIDDVKGCFFGYVDSTYSCETLAGSPTILDHGTQVAGVIGATHNNGEGIKGVCPNCKIMRAGVPYFFTNVLEAINYSVENGAKVINMSWGFLGDTEGTQAFQEMLDYAHNSGVTLVAANGNNGTTFIFRPASLNHVIGVASLNRENKKATSSTYGELTDISAPGDNILTTHHSSRYNVALNTYVPAAGTSFAAAVVSGTAGMLLSYSPELTPTQIETIIKETADPITYTNDNQVGKMGAGRINAFRALYKSLNLKNVFKDTTIAAVQCYGNKTRLEIRDKKGVTVNGKPAKHILDNVYSHWVDNGSKINVAGTAWGLTMNMPRTCKLSQATPDF